MMMATTMMMVTTMMTVMMMMMIDDGDDNDNGDNDDDDEISEHLEGLFYTKWDKCSVLWKVITCIGKYFPKYIYLHIYSKA